MRITTYKTMIDENRKNILIKDKSTNYPVKSLDSPKFIAQMMCDVFSLDKMAEEYLYMISFDTKCHVTGVFEVSHGTVSSTIVGIRELFVRILLCGGCSFALVHNHPSGDTEFSNEDLLLTQRIFKASLIMDVKLLDHVIIGENGNYFSFAENGIVIENQN